MHTYSNVNKESNDTCYDADSLKDRRCNSSNNDYITKDYHSGRLGKIAVYKWLHVYWCIELKMVAMEVLTFYLCHL